MSSPLMMAPLGHSASHAPQLMHSSVIVVAIGDRLLGPCGWSRAEAVGRYPTWGDRSQGAGTALDAGMTRDSAARRERPGRARRLAPAAAEGAVDALDGRGRGRIVPADRGRATEAAARTER